MSDTLKAILADARESIAYDGSWDARTKMFDRAVRLCAVSAQLGNAYAKLLREERESHAK